MDENEIKENSNPNTKKVVPESFSHMEQQEYKDYTEKTNPKSNMFKDICLAFIVGGIICCIGEGFRMLYTNLGLEKESVTCLVTATLIAIACILTGFKLYAKLGKHAGAGSVIPITGFANSVVSPAIEFKSEGQIFGIGAKLFTIAGPVIVFGLLASVIYGVIYYFISIL